MLVSVERAKAHGTQFKQGQTARTSGAVKRILVTNPSLETPGVSFARWRKIRRKLEKERPDDRLVNARDQVWWAHGPIDSPQLHSNLSLEHCPRPPSSARKNHQGSKFQAQDYTAARKVHSQQARHLNSLFTARAVLLTSPGTRTSPQLAPVSTHRG